MRVVIQQNRGPNIIYTEIKPVLKNGVVHQITITRTYTQEGNSKRVANFTLPDEHYTEQFVAMLFGGFIVGPGLPSSLVQQAFRDNKLGEMYA